MSKEQQTPELCPTCGTLCNVTLFGLELVGNTGDETLATKNYIPNVGLEDDYARLKEENASLGELLMKNTAEFRTLEDQFDNLSESHRELYEAGKAIKSLVNWGLEESKKSLGHEEFKRDDMADYNEFVKSISNAEKFLKK